MCSAGKKVFFAFIHSFLQSKLLKQMVINGYYLSGYFAVVVKVVEGEGPLLPVVLLHRHSTLQLLKQRSVGLSASSSVHVSVYLCASSCRCPSFIQRGGNKRPVQC